MEDYFTGKKDYSDCINESLREVVDIEKTELRKRGADEFRALIQNYEKIKENLKISDENLEAMDYLRRWEKPSETKYAKLRAKKDFTFCLNIMENTTNKAGNKDIDVQKMIVGHPDNRISRLLSSKGNSLEVVKPIIIVPEEVMSGNLNLHNVYDFIKKGEFKPVVDAEKPKKRYQEIYLTILGKKIAFEIYDDVGYLKSKKKLNQVVAVFIKGSPFQFKDCKGIWGVDTIAKLFKKGKLISERLLSTL